MFTSGSAVESAPGMTADVDAANSEHAIGRLDAATKRSAGYAAAVAAGLVLLGLLLPKTAAAQQKVSAASEKSAGALATDDAGHAAVGKLERNRAAALTLHLPWLAPVGHRQPRRDDVPRKKTLSARESDQQLQQLLDLDIDRKLIICRC